MELAQRWGMDEERAEHASWVRISLELRKATGGERHHPKACRQKYVEQLRPGLSFRPMEAWEDDILIQAREKHLSYAHVARTLLPHRSERMLVNRARSPVFMRYMRAKQFADAITQTEDEEFQASLITTRPPPLPLPLCLLSQDHHYRNES